MFTAMWTRYGEMWSSSETRAVTSGLYRARSTVRKNRTTASTRRIAFSYACPYILYCKAYTRDKPSVDKRPKDCPLIEIPKGAEVAMTAEGLKMVYVPMEKEYGADDIDAD